jgi:hypothetical protein
VLLNGEQEDGVTDRTERKSPEPASAFARHLLFENVQNDTTTEESGESGDRRLLNGPVSNWRNFFARS